MDLLVSKWDEIKEYIKQEYGLSDISYNTWIKPLKIQNKDDKAIIIIPFDQSHSKKYISSKYGLLIQVEELSVKELYYSITTGFYEYGKDGNKAVERLKVMQANEVLDKLAHDGFIID